MLILSEMEMYKLVSVRLQRRDLQILVKSSEIHGWVA